MTVVEAIQRAFPWLVGLPLLPKLLFSGIVVLAALFLLTVLWITPPNVDRSDVRELLRRKLLEQTRELNAIEAQWDERQNDLEDLAQRVISILRPDHPASAAAVAQAMHSPTLRELARTTRREIRTVLDTLDTRPER